MATLIGRILALAGPMPKPEAHRRYLETLQSTAKKTPAQFSVQKKNAAVRAAAGGGQ